MPSWEKQAGGLLPEEIAALADYLRAGTPATPSTPALKPGDPERGSLLFTLNCAGCHGPAGLHGIAPALASATFQQSASDSFIVTTIRNGRRGTAMPAFQRAGAAGLTDSEIADLLAHIRTWGQGAAAASQAAPQKPMAHSGGAR